MTLTQAEVRRGLARLSELTDDWQGIPVPLGQDMPLRLAPGHPLERVYREMGRSATVEPGGLEVELVADPDYYDRPDADDPRADDRVVNRWWSWKRNAEVLVFDRGGEFDATGRCTRVGHRFAVLIPAAPDRSMERLTLWIQTIGAADAWDLDAEHRARATLRAMLSERQWMHYDVTGSFFETSPRSRITYLFRRLRPTIAMTGRSRRDGRDEQMRVLAVLCMHPIGYYDRTWAGCMVPSDDVIAHVAWMRGDEARFWKYANQHDPASPEAGL